VVVIAKVDAAAAASVQQVTETVQAVNPQAVIVRAASPIQLDDAEAVKGQRILVVEDGPTTTHGGMAYGAGYVAATRAQPAQIVDPRPFAVPEIATVYAQYPHIGCVLPAMGYSTIQLKGLQQTIRNAAVDVVVAATPIDLAALIAVDCPIVRARYEFAEVGEPSLGTQIEKFLAHRKRH
jgi:predicted GTPase